MAESFGRPDFREGVTSFLEKRDTRVRSLGDDRRDATRRGGGPADVNRVPGGSSQSTDDPHGSV